MDIFRIICEEFQKFNEALEDYEWYDDQEDQSLADKMYARRFGINPEQQQPKQIEDNSDTKGQLVGNITDHAYTKLKRAIPLFLNPQSLNGFAGFVRGVLMHNGDFYLAEGIEPLHYNILKFLADDGLVSHNVTTTYDQVYPQEFVCVERQGKTSTFVQSAAYDEFPDYYGKMMDMANNMHPFNFKVKQHV